MNRLRSYCSSVAGTAEVVCSCIGAVGTGAVSTGAVSIRHKAVVVGIAVESIRHTGVGSIRR